MINFQKNDDKFPEKYINLVCLTFNIRKEWLINGQGEIFEPSCPEIDRQLITDEMQFLKKFFDARLLAWKAAKDNFFVIGDINLDYIKDADEFTGSASVGGNGNIIAQALSINHPVCLYGNTGADDNGRELLNLIGHNANFFPLILSAKGKATGVCTLTYWNKEHKLIRVLDYNNKDHISNDANDYSLEDLHIAIELVNVGPGWSIFISPTIIPRYYMRKMNGLPNYDRELPDYIKSFTDIIDRQEVPLIMKIHRDFKYLPYEEFNSIILHADLFYTELKTLENIYKFDIKKYHEKMKEEYIIQVLEKTSGKIGQQIIVCYGGGSGVDNVRRFVRKDKITIKINPIDEEIMENYQYNDEKIKSEDRVGYIDRFVINNLIKDVKKLPK